MPAATGRLASPSDTTARKHVGARRTAVESTADEDGQPRQANQRSCWRSTASPAGTGERPRTTIARQCPRAALRADAQPPAVEELALSISTGFVGSVDAAGRVPGRERAPARRRGRRSTQRARRRVASSARADDRRGRVRRRNARSPSREDGESVREQRRPNAPPGSELGVREERVDRVVLGEESELEGEPDARGRASRRGCRTGARRSGSRRPCRQGRRRRAPARLRGDS